MVFAKENLREVLVCWLLLLHLHETLCNCLSSSSFDCASVIRNIGGIRSKKTILQTPQQLIQYMVLEIQFSKFMAVIKIH